MSNDSVKWLNRKIDSQKESIVKRNSRVDSRLDRLRRRIAKLEDRFAFINNFLAEGPHAAAYHVYRVESERIKEESERGLIRE